jgi:hypothetical protein
MAVQYLHHFFCHILKFECINILRLISASITEKVWRDDPISFLTEVAKLTTPIKGGRRESMKEKNVWLPMDSFVENIAIFPAAWDLN